jgi:hypothetical protein
MSFKESARTDEVSVLLQLKKRVLREAAPIRTLSHGSIHGILGCLGAGVCDKETLRSIVDGMDTVDPMLTLDACPSDTKLFLLVHCLRQPAVDMVQRLVSLQTQFQHEAVRVIAYVNTDIARDC